MQPIATELLRDGDGDGKGEGEGKGKGEGAGKGKGEGEGKGKGEGAGEGGSASGGLVEVLADRRARLRVQHDHLAGLLTGTGWTYTLPDGGLCLWLHLAGTTTATGLAERAARRGLAVSPGPLFAADRATLTHHLRLAFTATSEVLTRAVGLLR
ncbi:MULTISPECIES: aminotransferase class I/II-fold pyridoxal phosphate-dependent enzyme [Streptomyces]|uniref:aminotransferase class I/II-fold pyridoxal phosphate-dependent enzyme n=1 Tax=Streptomyces TaxID=1883 RepID=UPI0030B84CAA